MPHVPCLLLEGDGVVHEVVAVSNDRNEFLLEYRGRAWSYTPAVSEPLRGAGGDDYWACQDGEFVPRAEHDLYAGPMPAPWRDLLWHAPVLVVCGRTGPGERTEPTRPDRRHWTLLLSARARGAAPKSGSLQHTLRRLSAVREAAAAPPALVPAATLPPPEEEDDGEAGAAYEDRAEEDRGEAAEEPDDTPEAAAAEEEDGGGEEPEQEEDDGEEDDADEEEGEEEPASAFDA